MINNKKRNVNGQGKKLILFGMVFFVLGFMGGWFINICRNYPRTVQIRQSGFKLIRPLVESETVGVTKELKPFRHKADKLVGEIIKKKRASHISVYFRDLNNGLWFGINEDEKFTPASLLKVPILMAYLKLAQKDQKLLKKKLEYKIKKTDLAQGIAPSKNIETGKSYTVDRLLYLMVVYSDNISKDILLENLPQEVLHDVYSDMGLEIPNVRRPEDYMSVVEFASFFRILFNASYLDKAMSEKALEYLTKVEFKDGIQAGIPDNVTLAHKFGERGNTMTGVRQLHECGIVYYPGYPYLLCVMTRGRDYGELSAVIKDISSYFYNEVDKHARAVRAGADASTTAY